MAGKLSLRESLLELDLRLPPGIVSSDRDEGVINTHHDAPSTSARSFFQAHVDSSQHCHSNKSLRRDTVLDGNFIVRYDVDRPVSGVPFRYVGSRQAEPPKSIHPQGLVLEEKTE